MSHLRNRERAFAGAGGPVDDEQIVLPGSLERLVGSGEGLYGDNRFNASTEPDAVPVDRRSLLRIEIGDLSLEPARGGLAGKRSGQGRLADPALLRDERNNSGHAPFPPPDSGYLAASYTLGAIWLLDI